MAWTKRDVKISAMLSAKKKVLRKRLETLLDKNQDVDGRV